MGQRYNVDVRDIQADASLQLVRGLSADGSKCGDNAALQAAAITLHRALGDRSEMFHVGAVPLRLAASVLSVVLDAVCLCVLPCRKMRRTTSL